MRDCIYQRLTHCGRSLGPISRTTVVMMASLLTFLLSLCSLTTSSIRILLTISPETRTKSDAIICFVSISRRASPTERASRDDIGIILSPEDGRDQGESLQRANYQRFVACTIKKGGITHLIACRINPACEEQNT